MYLLLHIFVLGALLLTLLSGAKSQCKRPTSLLSSCKNLLCEENVVCPDGHTKILKKCFKTINKELNWEKAKEECDGIGDSLAILNDCNLLKPLSKFLKDSSPNSKIIWIGASNRENEGRFTWVDGTDVQMGVPFWGTYSMYTLAPFFENANCAQIDPNKQYYFYEANCTNLGTPLCQTEPLSVEKTENCVCNDDAVKTKLKCPKDFEDVGGSCFYFPTNASDLEAATTFEESRDVCQRFYPDSDLPILDSCNLFKELVDFINKNEKYQAKFNGYWVNAKRSEGELFIWGNGKNLYPGNPFWGEGFGYNQPTPDLNQKCAIMYGTNNYYFHDYFCNESGITFPLCQADPIPQE